MNRLITLIAMLINMAFICGCSIIIGAIAASQDEPTSLVVTIESDPPGAEIYINEKMIGTAPVKVTIEGLAKEHKVVFIKNGYQTRIERVSITPDRQLDKKNLSVIRSDGTSFEVGDQTLNVILQKEEIFP